MVSRKKTVKTTAYTHNERDHVRYGRKTAIGTTLRTGVVATDWSVFPLGTKLRIDGKPYVVEDYGSALVGKSTPVVDIYKTSFSSMNKHGTRMYDIEVISWGCFDESKEILSKRLKWKHCREMYYNIDRRDNGV
jgi:3D (Asp-Asp-Asp) domain-containing protein|tara:strand:+ start:26988 stop:27389 length:402 start_codon:yes stop_codon:yes gene_type:complete